MQVAEQVIRVSAHRCNSWSCPHCAIKLGRLLGRRLRERFDGRRVLMLTLTLNREKFASPRAAYFYIKRNKSISRAIAAFSTAHQVDLHGCWISKMELQQSGWPHWHVLVEVPSDLGIDERGAFDHFWKHGFSTVSEGNVGYLCKYAAKGAAPLEAIRLSGLPGRGVRWVTASRGFWSSESGVDMPDEIPWGSPEELDRLDAQFMDECERQSSAEEVLRLTEALDELHVVRVETCGVLSRVLLMDCEGGRPVVRASCPVKFAADVVRSIVAEECGADASDESFAITDAEWQRVVSRVLGFYEEIDEDGLYLFLRRNRNTD